MILTISAHALANALGWTMIHSLWEGLLLAVLLVGCSHRRSSERRYITQCVGLAGLLAAVLVTFVLEMRSHSTRGIAFEVLKSIRASEHPSGLYQIFTRDASQGSISFNWDGVAAGLAWSWIGGFVMMSVRAGVAAWRVRSLRRNATEWENDSWQIKAGLWAKELGITRSVRLCLTAFNDVPAVIGHFKPFILLPAAIVTHLSVEQLEAVVLHELMHVRRNDYLVNLLQLICETVLFFHPLAWWLSASIREEREHCCDIQVAKRDSSPLPYAKALLALEELRVNSPEILALGAGGSSLKRRIKRLLAPPQLAPGFGGWTISICSLVLVALLGFSIWPKAIAQQPARPSLFEMRVVVNEGGEELPFARRNAPAKLRLSPEIVLNETHVKSAKVVKDPISGDPQISIRLNNEGAERFAKATRDNIGKQLAIVIRQQVVSAPRINEPITGGMVVINGNFTEQDAADLARKLDPSSSAEKKGYEIQLQAFFIEITGDPSKQFNLGTSLDSASDDIAAWNLTQEGAKEILMQAHKMDGTKLLQAPLITTTSGKAARVEIGDLPEQEGVFSVNAKGFVTSNSPVDQAESRLIGQSIELLPELGENHLIVAGKFLNREKVSLQPGRSLVRTFNSAPFYLNLPTDGSFALGQKSKVDPTRYLLLVVISDVSK